MATLSMELPHITITTADYDKLDWEIISLDVTPNELIKLTQIILDNKFVVYNNQKVKKILHKAISYKLFEDIEFFEKHVAILKQMIKTNTKEFKCDNREHCIMCALCTLFKLRFKKLVEKEIKEVKMCEYSPIVYSSGFVLCGPETQQEYENRHKNCEFEVKVGITINYEKSHKYSEAFGITI
jgi:hypothetical protein